MIKLEYIIAIMLIGGIVLKSIIFCYYAYKISEKSIKNKSSSSMILIKPTSSNLNSYQVLLKKIDKLYQELIVIDKHFENYNLVISQNKANNNILEKEQYTSNNRKKKTQYCQFCRAEMNNKANYCYNCGSKIIQSTENLDLESRFSNHHVLNINKKE